MNARTILFIFLVLLMAGCSGETTWRYDTPPGDDDDDVTDDDDDDDGDDDDDDDDMYEKVLWGERWEDEAWTGFFFVDPAQGGELCEVEYEVASWVSTDDCADCVEAWTLTRGEGDAFLDVHGTCGDLGWTGLEGTSLGVGHDGDLLWADLGQGWQAMEDAEGEIGGDEVWFEIWLDQGGDPDNQGLLGRAGTATVSYTSYEGTEELYFAADQGQGEDICRIRYDLSSTAVRDDCADCEWAFDLVVSGAELITETAPGCLATVGADSAALGDLEGTVVSYGYDPDYFGHIEILFVEQGGAWAAADHASWDASSGAFSYDWEDGYHPY